MSFVREFQRLLTGFAHELPEESDVPELEADEQKDLYELSETVEEVKDDPCNRQETFQRPTQSDVVQPFVLSSVPTANRSPEFRVKSTHKPEARKLPQTSVKKERLLISKRFLS